jgi:hypothetical protein
LGAGTELSLPFLGGLRVSPEIGYKADHFFSRYQNSKSWKDQDSRGAGDGPPESDFSLKFHYGAIISFYFK